jgi:hypothetical protein
MASGLMPGTENAKFDPSNDHKTPKLGSLNLGAMTSLTALAGTNGVSVSLVHGDEWNQMEGNQTENVLKYRKTTIKLNDKYTVNGDVINRVVGTTNDTRIGVHNQTNVAPRNDTFVSTRTEDHHQPEQKHQPTSKQEITSSSYESHITQNKYIHIYVCMYDIKTDVVLGLQLGYSTLKGELGVIATKALIIKSQSNAMDAKFQAFVTKTTLTTILCAALQAKIIAFDGNAGIAANADSPFA